MAELAVSSRLDAEVPHQKASTLHIVLKPLVNPGGRINWSDK